MITGFIARRGQGKTLLMSRRAYRRYKAGFRVLANYGLKFPHEKLNVKRLLAMGEDLQDCVICIDEVHTIFDSRDSMKERNKLLSYLITQTRKRNVVVYYTTQHEMQVDIRLRRNTDYWVKCKRVGKHAFKYRVFDGLTGHRVTTMMVDGRASYGLFDTRETITDGFTDAMAAVEG